MVPDDTPVRMYENVRQLSDVIRLPKNVSDLKKKEVLN